MDNLPDCINVFDIPEDVLPSFDDVWSLKPDERSYVFVAGANPRNANRFYSTYGLTPEKKDYAKTYMFSKDGEISNPQPIPEMFQVLLSHLNKVRHFRYNQMVINWYETPQDYTSYHHDCLTGMVEPAEVSIVTLLEKDTTEKKDLRKLVFKCKKERDNISIFCTNRQCISFKGQALLKWSHGLPKGDGTELRRISISFRSYDDSLL